MPISIVPAVVLLVGLLMYILATKPKVEEIGRLAFFAGLLVLVLVLAGETFRVGR